MYLERNISENQSLISFFTSNNLITDFYCPTSNIGPAHMYKQIRQLPKAPIK
jgi:hypothetical protein